MPVMTRWAFLAGFVCGLLVASVAFVAGLLVALHA